MRVRSSLFLIMAILVFLTTGLVFAQNLVSSAPVKLSLTTPNESVKVTSIVCMEGSGSPAQRRVETPLWVQWLDFKTLKFRKGNNTLYQTLGTFDKTVEKLSGGYIQVKATSAAQMVEFVVEYSKDEGKTWQTRTFPAKTALSCLPAGSEP
jgi:hypothetical protein